MPPGWIGLRCQGVVGIFEEKLGEYYWNVVSGTSFTPINIEPSGTSVSIMSGTTICIGSRFLRWKYADECNCEPEIIYRWHPTRTITKTIEVEKIVYKKKEGSTMFDLWGILIMAVVALVVYKYIAKHVTWKNTAKFAAKFAWWLIRKPFGLAKQNFGQIANEFKAEWKSAQTTQKR